MVVHLEMIHYTGEIFKFNAMPIIDRMDDYNEKCIGAADNLRVVHLDCRRLFILQPLGIWVNVFFFVRLESR